MKVKLGIRDVEFPSENLQELQSCNHLLHDIGALRTKLQTHGYLFIKDFHDRGEVLSARQSILEYINSTGDGKLDDVSEGILNHHCTLGCVPFMEGKEEITHTAKVKTVLEGERPFEFFKRFFKDEVVTFDYKWLRAMPREGFTGAHVDNVYMSRGSDQRFQDTYGNLDVEAAQLQGTGWFTEDPWEITTKFGGVWKTANYRAGDVLVFTLRTLHMSTVNLTNIARISCDTRWQPASDSRDLRYFGTKAVKEDTKQAFGVWAKPSIQESDLTNTIEKFKLQWNLI